MKENDAGNAVAAQYPVGASFQSAIEEIDLRDLFSTLLGGKWWVAAAIFGCVFVAVIYVTLATPIYEADALVQVEDAKAALGVYSELSDVMSNEGGVGAEIEIIRSRSVLGDVVDDLALTTQVDPKYLPIVGRFLAKRSESGAPNEPPFGLFTSYSWGGDDIDIRRMEVTGDPEAFSSRLIAVGEGRYQILAQSDELLAIGQVGETVQFTLPNQRASVLLNVRSIAARSGVEFKITFTPRASTILKLKGRVNVAELGSNTGVLRVRVEGSESREIQSIVNSVVNSYLRQNVERRSEQAQRSLEFLNEQLPEVQSDLEQSETQLARFRERNKTIDLSLETESILRKSVSLDQKLSELELKRAELTRSYTANHPVLKTLDEQREQLLEEKQSIEGAASSLPDVQQDLLRYVRRVEVTTQLYTFLLNKTQELRVVKAGTVGNVRILDDAAVTPSPIKPRKALSVALAGIIGLILGVATVLVRRALRTGVTDPDAVEQVIGSPVYAVLPFSDEVARTKDKKGAAGGGRALVTAHQPTAVISEAFRSLRTSLHFALADAGACPVVAISGPAPNVGKTFVAANLAYTLAASGREVLFVDADMRRGDADKAFDISRQPGLSHLLVDQADADVVKTAQACGTLKVIGRGKAPPNPSELLLGDRFQQLIAEWKTQYDFIVIDTPPILAVTDASQIASLCDALFLVGRAGRTHMHELMECRKRFERGGVAIKGVLINGMTASLAHGGRYGYGYGYYDYKYAPTND